MLDPETLAGIGIHQWNEGFGEFFEGSDIFVGNGFSINICERLNYRRILEVFSNKASPNILKLFDVLDTSNFEYVIDSLRMTRTVSNLLGTELSQINGLIEEIKSGLIHSIQQTHPTYKETNFPLMDSLAFEFRQFRHIYTTNYDVFLYRIILANNGLIEGRRMKGILFQDDFYESISPTQLGFGGSFDSTLRKIYYLHGSLFFYRQVLRTYKLRKIDNVEYINLIGREIFNNNLPVFVAEGSSSDKQLAINNNSYLSYCGEHLKRKRTEEDDRLTVYGFSFSPPDNHLIQMIATSGVKKMAVSMYPGHTKEELEKERSRINNIFGEIELAFYDSTSIFDFNGEYSYLSHTSPS